MMTTKKFLDKQRLIGDKKADLLIKKTFASNQQGALYELFKLDEKEKLAG